MCGNTSTAGAAEADGTGKRDGEGEETQTAAGTRITQVVHHFNNSCCGLVIYWTNDCCQCDSDLSSRAYL